MLMVGLLNHRQGFLPGGSLYSLSVLVALTADLSQILAVEANFHHCAFHSGLVAAAPTITTTMAPTAGLYFYSSKFPNHQNLEIFAFEQKLCLSSGFKRQWQKNGGRCGVCGDPWDLPQVSNFLRKNLQIIQIQMWDLSQVLYKDC